MSRNSKTHDFCPTVERKSTAVRHEEARSRSEPHSATPVVLPGRLGDPGMALAADPRSDRRRSLRTPESASALEYSKFPKFRIGTQRRCGTVTTTALGRLRQKVGSYYGRVPSRGRFQRAVPAGRT